MLRGSGSSRRERRERRGEDGMSTTSSRRERRAERRERRSVLDSIAQSDVSSVPESMGSRASSSRREQARMARRQQRFQASGAAPPSPDTVSEAVRVANHENAEERESALLSRAGSNPPHPQQPSVDSLLKEEDGLSEESGEEEIEPYAQGDPCDLCESVHRFHGEHDLSVDETALLSHECQTIQQALCSAGKSLASPPETQEVLSAAVEKEVVSVLDTYKEKGALAADNILDKVFVSWESSAGGRPAPQALNALRYILHLELDPDSAPWPHEVVPSELGVQTLSGAINCYAWFTGLTRQFSAHSKQVAQLLITDTDEGTVSKLPRSWVVGVQAAARTPVDIAVSRLGPKPPKRMTPKEKWNKVLEKDPSAPPVLNDVMGMIGLGEVKEEMINQYYRIKLAQDQGDQGASSYNVRFEGNPGTGKSTVARHYNTFMQQLGVLPEGCMFLETSGGSLLFKGVKYLQEELDKLKKAGGGLVFVDEAHQLMSDRQGQMVLDFIVPIAEKLMTAYGPIVWIFAGYTKQMEKLFEHDPGLPSRFPLHFVFKDYTDEELLSIFNSMLTTQSTSGGGAKEEIVKSTVPNPVPAAITKPKRRDAKRIGDTASDAWGNEWKFNGNSWYDQYNNTTGYGVNGLGAPNNPLVGQGSQWTYADGLWKSESGEVQGHYPGSKAPKRPQAPQTQKREVVFKSEAEKYPRIAMRRLGRRRGQVGFGNARAVRVYFDQVRGRQAARIQAERAAGKNPDIFLLTRADILGPNQTEAELKSTAAYKTLMAMEGLAPVKESVNALIKHAVQNADREEQEKPVLGVALNRIFLGNPGTGKTTVAKIYGQLLTEMGLLSKGDVILKSPSDFIGDVTGSSEKLTRDILRNSEGCVLVIDEAYSLYSGGDVGGQNDPFKTAVVDTIVEQVQSVPGDDRAVVMLGYREDMERMLKNVNPGLSRRFQLEFAFDFPDYDDTALTRILIAKARKDGLQVDLSVAKRAVASLARARAKPHFGNAGAVDNLLSAAKLRLQQRGSTGTTAGLLTLEDFSVDQEGPDHTTLDTLLDDIIGSESVKTKLESLRDTVLFAQARGEDPKEHLSYNYLFLGNPGTGKTTIARRMGTMFKALGLLPDDAVEEISASDLSTGFSGQAGKKTREIMRKARGGVLFIDEAYQLNPVRGGTYMTEAVDELVKCLTAEEYKGKVLVILAGYELDMEDMLQTNPGLKSRFAERVFFEDLTAQAAADLLAKKLERKLKLPVEQCDETKLPPLATRLVESNGFGNGRDIDTWCQMTYQEVAKRSRGQPKTDVTLADISTALDRLLESRMVSTTGQSCGAPPDRPGEQSASQTATVTAVAVKTAQATEEAMAEEEAPPPPPPDDENFNPFEGVDARVLQKMQDFLEANGLNTEDGVNGLAGMNKDDPRFKALVSQMVAELGMDPDEATAQLVKWQIAHEDLQAELDKIKQNQNQMTKQPIWRCGVCGRDNKPWIVCYVAPYIAYYEPIKPKA